LIGMGIKDMRWPQPTRAGDTLRATIEVLAQKPSASQPGFGVVQLRWTTLNQRDEIAMQLETSIWVARRPPLNRTSMKKACPVAGAGFAVMFMRSACATC
jgi:acyl dehydratase